MNHEKLTKGMVVLYTILGFVFITYVIVSMFNGFQNFDDVIFPIYFATILSSSYCSNDLLKNKSIQYPFIIMFILFIYFLIKTYLI